MKQDMNQGISALKSHENNGTRWGVNNRPDASPIISEYENIRMISKI